MDDVVDGFYDAATEPGLPNVSVDLIVDINKDGAWDSGDAYVATLSDLGGLFRFRGLLADRYLVRVSDTLAVLRRFAPTVTATTGSTPTDNTNKAQPFAIDLAAGQTNTLADFGYREYEAFGTGSTLQPGMLGDQIWLDVDGNGIFSLAAGDQPLPGVTLEARSGGVVMATATTGADGKYLLMDLPLGRAYDVAVTDLFGVLEKYQPTTLGLSGQNNHNQGPTLFHLPGLLLLGSQSRLWLCPALHPGRPGVVGCEPGWGAGCGRTGHPRRAPGSAGRHGWGDSIRADQQPGHLCLWGSAQGAPIPWR